MCRGGFDGFNEPLPLQAVPRYSNNTPWKKYYDDEVANGVTDVGTQKTRQKNPTNKDRMLRNPEVRRWYDNLSRGSPLTAGMRLGALDTFCRAHEMTPMELADLGMKDLKTATNLLEDHVTMMEEKNHAPNYITVVVRAVKSWLEHFDIKINRRIKVKNDGHATTIQDERVPNSQEMMEIQSRATMRASVIISLMAKAGLRPEVIGNHDGTDGLRMRDLPDMVIQQGEAKCVRLPNQVVVRASLSKARHKYFTFLSSTGTHRLVVYLNDRLANGEPLHGDSPVVAPDYIHKTNRGGNKNKPFLLTHRISEDVRKTFRPRFQWRPYVLRAFFDTELLVAESKGKMTHDFRVFFMGHKGSMEARYTTNKGILPEVLVREMRESFRRSEEYLDIEFHDEDPAIKQREDLQETVQNASPEELGLMLKVLQDLRIGKTDQARK